ncbi:hypothetical protein A3K73_00380 [Candidatus Pacearchaeota archaeon RBG_13_36_9]|nr:MAG: hypothetical protein A3K73_00380 [Candidatus Pacearchaeota archaeon RBG_13_36_9]
MKTEIIKVNGEDYQVRIIIEDRIDSKVSVNQKIISMHLPDCLSREELFRELLKMKLWARQKILENPGKFQRRPLKEYKDGHEIVVGSEKYTLRIQHFDKSSSSARMDGNTLFLSISSNLTEMQKSKHISTLISRCIARKKLPEVKKRVEELNRLYFQKDIKKVFLKHNQSNWGSCSEKGNINFSTRLLFAPPDVFDYLCIHELAHLSEQNHSKQFWALVEKAMPDYKEKEKWIKENGASCNF